MEFHRVRAAGKAVATVTNANGRMKIKLPEGFAGLYGIDPASQVQVLYGTANRKSAIKITPDAKGDWKLIKMGKSLHIRIPELAAKAEFKDVPVKSRKVTGGVEIELPAPWDLVDGDVVEAEAA